MKYINSRRCKQISKNIKQKVNVKFDTSKPEGDKDRTGNIEKAKQVLEWTPKTSIDEGLKNVPMDREIFIRLVFYLLQQF